MKKYQVTLTQEQLDVLTNALDLYVRVGLGKFEEVLEVYDPNRDLPEGARAYMGVVKAFAGHPEHGNYGIHNEAVREEFRMAFDMKQTILHRIAWDKNPSTVEGSKFRGPDPISTLPPPILTPVEGRSNA